MGRGRGGVGEDTDHTQESISLGVRYRSGRQLAQRSKEERGYGAGGCCKVGWGVRG